MAGIVSYGAYVPYARIDRDVLYKFWGGFPIPGERSVACFDEDSLTMAVEAGIDCLTGIDPRSVDGLYFATTTSPYKQNLCSSIMAVALDMREDIRTMDVTGGLRADTSAMGAALDAIKAGSMKSALVTAGETMLATPGGMFEHFYSDGAASVLLGNEGVIASIEGSYSISDDFSGTWRADGDVFLRSWEDRMIMDKGYSEVFPQAVKGLMEKYNLTPSDITKVVLDAPHDMRRHAKLAATLKFDPSQVQDPMFLNVGNTGSALAMMILVAALEEAKAGDKIIFASYGNGADAFLLEVTPEIEKIGARRGIKNHLASKRMIDNYSTYLRWRKLVEIDHSLSGGFVGVTSISIQRRYHKAIIGLWGVKCKACGTPQYTVGMGATAKVCVRCQAREQFEDYRFADKQAKVFSFTQDNLAQWDDPPLTLTVVDFEGGGRSQYNMTDLLPDEVEVGMTVEMTFRRISTEKGFHNYFWKTRPVRC